MRSAATLITEAKAALAAADAAEQHELDARQLASDARWKAAECMAALSDGGMGHRDIAASIGVSKSTVDYYVSCWQKGGHVRGHLFTDVLREVRGGWGHAPTSIEGKAKAVAAYIAEPEVWSRPEVIEAAVKAQKIHSASQLPPAPVDTRRPPLGLLARETMQRATYWDKLGWSIRDCRTEIDAAITEMRRSGVPNGGGTLIRELRQLAASVAKAQAVLADQAIGRAEHNGH